MNIPYNVLGLLLSKIIEDNEILLADELIEFLDNVEGEIHITKEETKS